MIGKLRHRITIQEESRAADSGGGYTNTWTNLATDPTVWAAIEPLRGREFLQARQLHDAVTHRVTIRHRSDVTAGMRLLRGSRAFNIRSVIDKDERGRWLELMCEEGVAT
jgi:SPP1 family predicted phage head-tail adaptor